jgi:hypothetical protein
MLAEPGAKSKTNTTRVGDAHERNGALPRRPHTGSRFGARRLRRRLKTATPAHVPTVVILAYVRYRLSYAEVSEWLAERGVVVDQSTIYRPVIIGMRATRSRYRYAGHDSADAYAGRLNIVIEVDNQAGTGSMTSTESRWTPVLDGPERERALDAVRAIARDLETHYEASPAEADVEAASLAAGRGGVALFFAYLAEALADDAVRETAIRLVEEALDLAAAARQKSYALYEGFTGTAWMLAHLDGWLLELSDNDPNGGVDAALLELAATRPWHDDFDLLTGLVGIGVYCLERLPRPIAAACLEHVVARLAELAESDGVGVTWRTPPETLAVQVAAARRGGAYNLGLAHGVPGVIALLGKACSAGVAVTTARPLLGRAVPWLLAQRLSDETSAAFPALAGAGAVPEPARSAWCYGDPGVASALLVAARHASVPGWQEEALAFARRAAARPEAECRAVDAGLCHGAGALAHMFNRLYQATGEAIFRDAARRWVARVLDQRVEGMGIGGYSAYRVDGSRWSDPGFLDGAAGTGLALLAAATSLDPRWDRVLLLS